MQIKLCKKSIDRLGGGTAPLLESLRDRQHSVIVKDCLERCQTCDRGVLIAMADGMPLSARHADKLLQDIDALE